MFSISIRATPPELGGGIGGDLVAAERALHRRALLRLVRRQILLRDEPPLAAMSSAIRSAIHPL
jgi:hypothetical protein